MVPIKGTKGTKKPFYQLGITTYTYTMTCEQGLVQDLVDEQIKMYGLECYYIPRQIHEDKLWNDIYYSQFKDSYLIEMYLENFEQFGGNGDMLSLSSLVVMGHESY